MISRWRSPRKPQRKALPQRGGGLHLVGKTRIVEAQLADALAQFLEIRRIGGEEAAEHHRLDIFIAGQRFARAVFLRGDGIADGGIGDFLDLRGDKADVAGAERFEVQRAWA